MTTITNSALTRGFRTTNFFRTGSRPSFSSQYSFAFDLAIGYSVSWHRSYKCFNTNNNSQGFDDCFTTRCNVLQKRIRATPEHSGSTSEPLETPCDHPCEDIENMVAKNKNDLHLSNAQITRTIIEIHHKATLMFSAVIHDDDENIFWPDVPYITDDHGGIYFKVNEDEDILQVLTTESQYVQVLIGFDDVDQLTQMEFPAVSADFETEEVTDEDEFEEDDDWVAIFEEEEKLDSSTLDDWSNLETMQSTHPMFFAKRLVEVVSSPPLDGMDQPSACLAIEGLLRPVFVEEYPIIQKHLSDIQSSQDSGNPIGRPLEIDHENKINSTFTSNAIPDGPDKNDNLKVRTSFYKLEMSNIHLITSYGNQACSNF